MMMGLLTQTKNGWMKMKTSDPTEQTVTITLKEYESLLDDQRWRLALEAGGVDGWEWYDLSLEQAGYFDNEDE